MEIRMLDLKSQYDKIKPEIDSAIHRVLDNTNFINGKEVSVFEESLSVFLGSRYVIACANGTDALQIAMMALDLKPGDEVIVPAFTYVATAEVIALLGLVPVLVDVDKATFNIKIEDIEKAISPKTKAIVPVHLFGQSAQMEKIMTIAGKYGLNVIEDVAQALGADFTFSDGSQKKCGTIGHIGCTSFFPSKNLGCFGDGGAIFTQDKNLAEKLRMIANHGQRVKYYHDVIGCNSRLDTLQAAILDVKLKYLNDYAFARYKSASLYKKLLKGINGIELPFQTENSTHVYHQFTIVVDQERDALKRYLEERGVPSMIYYPLPLNKQKAFSAISKTPVSLINSEFLSQNVLSLPIHTEMSEQEQIFISETIVDYFKSKNK